MREEEEGIEVDEYNYEPNLYDDGVWKLPPQQVRGIAKNIEFCKEVTSAPISESSFSSPQNGVWSKITAVVRSQISKKDPTASVILSFLVRDPTALQVADAVSRIHVYCDTGTVGVCRIQNDQVREMFFRDCSLRRLQQILQKPPPLLNLRQMETFLNQVTNLGQEQQNTSNHQDDDNQDDTTWVSAWMDETLANEEQDMKNDIELHDIAIDILEASRQELQRHAQHLVQSKVEDDESSRDSGGQDIYPNRRRKQDSDLPPTIDFHYSFSSSKMMKTADQWMKQVTERQENVLCAATNGSSMMWLLASGLHYATSDLPPTLQKILESKEGKASMKYVSLASNNRFFVSFDDGECNWFGPKSLDAILKDSSISKRVVCLSFGKQNSAYFIVFEDGTWQYGGQGIPDGLLDKLKERKFLQDLACVSLGPEGEWFLKAKNGRMWWGGVSTEMDDAYNSAMKRRRKLKFACFGIDNSYLMTFT